MQPFEAVILISYYDSPPEKSMNLKITLGIPKGTPGREPENRDPGPHPIPVLFKSPGEDVVLSSLKKAS
jgi:hypothetical protein